MSQPSSSSADKALALPPDYGRAALLSLLFCLPLGLIALCYSQRVRSCREEKDWEGAWRASVSAYRCCVRALSFPLIAAGVILLHYLIYGSYF